MSQLNIDDGQTLCTKYVNFTCKKCKEVKLGYPNQKVCIDRSCYLGAKSDRAKKNRTKAKTKKKSGFVWSMDAKK